MANENKKPKLDNSDKTIYNAERARAMDSRPKQRPADLPKLVMGEEGLVKETPDPETLAQARAEAGRKVAKKPLSFGKSTPSDSLLTKIPYIRRIFGIKSRAAYIEDAATIITQMMQFDALAGEAVSIREGRGGDSQYVVINVPKDLSHNITQKMTTTLITALNELDIAFNMPSVNESGSMNLREGGTMDTTLRLHLPKADDDVEAILKRVQEKLGIKNTLDRNDIHFDLATFQMVVETNGDVKMPIGLKIQFRASTQGADIMADILKKNYAAAALPAPYEGVLAFKITIPEKVQKLLTDLKTNQISPSWGQPEDLGAKGNNEAAFIPEDEKDAATAPVVLGKLAVQQKKTASYAAATAPSDSSGSLDPLKSILSDFKSVMFMKGQYNADTTKIDKLHIMVPEKDIGKLFSSLMSVGIEIESDQAVKMEYQPDLKIKFPGADTGSYRSLVVVRKQDLEAFQRVLRPKSNNGPGK